MLIIIQLLRNDFGIVWREDNPSAELGVESLVWFTRVYNIIPHHGERDFNF